MNDRTLIENSAYEPYWAPVQQKPNNTLVIRLQPSAKQRTVSALVKSLDCFIDYVFELPPHKCYLHLTVDPVDLVFVHASAMVIDPLVWVNEHVISPSQLNSPIRKQSTPYLT